MTSTSSIKRPATYPAWIDSTDPIPDPHGRAEKAVRFIKNLRHPKSKSRLFQLDPWQERIIRKIYGPSDENGDRLVRTVFLMVGRGARKTSLQAALALLHTIGPEKVTGGQVMLAAGDQKQASICYNECVSMLREDRRLLGLVKVREHYKSIKNIATGTTLEAVSSDGARRHGASPSFVCSDEVHIWKGRDLWEAIRTGCAKTSDSLHVITTTAGRGRESIAFETYDYFRRVAIGEIDDPASLPIIFESDPNADFLEEANWYFANPGLPVYPPLKSLRQLAHEAKNRPGERDSFRQLHLNCWLEGNASPFIEMAAWDACGEEPIDIEDRAGEQAWIGVDLASTTDLCAICVAMRDHDGRFSLFPYVFVPEGGLRRREASGEAPYGLWKEQGALIVTPGEVADHRAVEMKLRELCAFLEVSEVCFDPWQARIIQSNLLEDGINAVDHRQGFVSMSAPTKGFERAVLDGRLRHGGHPVLRWAVSNLVVDKDAAENLKPTKAKSKDRIDPAIAAIMALGRAEAGETHTSIYADATRRPEGLLFI